MAFSIDGLGTCPLPFVVLSKDPLCQGFKIHSLWWLLWHQIYHILLELKPLCLESEELLVPVIPDINVVDTLHLKAIRKHLEDLHALI